MLDIHVMIHSYFIELIVSTSALILRCSSFILELLHHAKEFLDFVHLRVRLRCVRQELISEKRALQELAQRALVMALMQGLVGGHGR